MSKMLNDATVLVTGASSGIGEQLAHQFAARGAELVLVARNRQKLEALASELQSRWQVKAQVLVVDLCRSEGPAELCQALLQSGTQVTHLAANAGVGMTGELSKSDPEGLADMLRLNVVGLAELTQRLLPSMVNHGRGGVLLVASVLGVIPLPLMAGYSASKAFVISFGEALATELRGTGVVVSVLCPGHVPSGFQRRAGFAEGAADMPGGMSAQRMASAAVAGFLAEQRRVTPGILNKLTMLCASMTPDFLLTRIAGRVVSSGGRFSAD